MKNELVEAILTISPDADELAYLALTSKPESQIRDRLAYQLHQQLADRDLVVAREWKRTDLAILEPEGVPVALVEAKAFLSANAIRDLNLRQWRERVRADVRKARACAKRAGAREAEIYALLIVTHVLTPVRIEQRSVIKYGRRLTEVTSWEEAKRNLRGFLPEAPAPREHSFGPGTAFGVRAEVTTWLFGPVQPVPDPVSPLATNT